MKYKFPEKFWWGAAASGPQTEGTKNKINKSIWDSWYEKEPNRFFNKISSDKVCETYDKFREDIKLMKNINMNSFRTSIQWSRLIKNYETNEICEDAKQFYNNYIDEMLKNEIEPIINLYHFDMPTYLQEKYGGWESKKVVRLFAEFSRICFELFGDKVKYWTTFNEPIVPVEGGYLYDFHYPNKKDIKLAIEVAYNIILAHTLAAEEYRKLRLTGEIGIILNITPTYTRSNSVEDKEAAKYADLFFNKSFMDPIVNGYFTKELIEVLKLHKILPVTIKEENDLILKSKIDFLGLNYYVPRRVKQKEKKDVEFKNPEYYFDYYVNENGKFNPYRDKNEILPKALYDIAMDVKNNYGNLKWFLAEIGIAMDLNSEGSPINGIIDDSFRTEIFKEHIVELYKAIEEGSNCFGIHQWTFIDNWSWCNSFNRRYGFYRLDLETGERIIKKHALFFKELAKNNGF